MNKLLLLFVVVFYGIVFAQDNLKIKNIVSVYDGDTIKVNLTCEIDILCKKISIRVKGVDTPEIRGKCLEEKALAKKARDFVRAKLKNAKTIELTNISRGKYFRIVAFVIIDSKNLTHELIKEDLGYAYTGKTKKKSWCKK